MTTIRVHIIDNYDSFTYNLVQYAGELGAEVIVERNDQTDINAIAQRQPTHLLISPGPGTPHGAGISLSAVRYFAGKIPVLGVCMGHQAIGISFGATLAASQRIMHGKTSMIRHDGKGVMNGIPSPFRATRYHSLALKSIPGCLEITSDTEDGEIMGVRHRRWAVEGVQYHPESICSEHGHALLKNFLQLTGAEQPVSCHHEETGK